MGRNSTRSRGLPRSPATSRAQSEPPDPDLAYPMEPVSFASPVRQRIVVVRDLEVMMPVGLLTADIPFAEIDAVELAYRPQELQWDRRDVLVDLARLWVSPLGDLVAPAIAFNADGDNQDELNLPLRSLAERSAGDEFLIPAPPTCIDPRGRGRRFHLARLPVPTAPSIQPNRDAQS